MTVTTLRISTDKAELDVPLIHRFLSEQSTWARGIPLAIVHKSLEHSLCFGGFLGAAQLAFARVISDYATFANLVDVFVLPGHRGRGYSKAIMSAVVSHPDLQGLRRFTLATGDAHDLYAQFGFTPLNKPEIFMERFAPSVYADASKPPIPA
ncbi:MAG: GNAT family N-acetyltransferase [Panacagrimonas sp.]